jgi:hypothetical protein
MMVRILELSSNGSFTLVYKQIPLVAAIAAAPATLSFRVLELIPQDVLLNWSGLERLRHVALQVFHSGVLREKLQRARTAAYDVTGGIREVPSSIGILQSEVDRYRIGITVVDAAISEDMLTAELLARLDSLEQFLS